MVQFKIFTIGIPGGEPENEEMNRFLRSKKVLQIESQCVTLNHHAFWSFSVKYLEYVDVEKERQRIDYRQLLDENTFIRFSKLRQIRKEIAQNDGIPAYAVFTDEELAGIAKLEVLSAQSLKSIKGIGDKKVEKYALIFIEKMADETGQ
jgi:superfamily II DNA helicase RecQ